MELLYLEDFSTGEVFDCGTTTLSLAEIVQFARQFDPQPFHIDPEAARESLYGGIIASGWHTCSAFMRLMVARFFRVPPPSARRASIRSAGCAPFARATSFAAR